MTSVFVYALFVNWLFILPGYQSTLARFGQYRAPWNCVFCITFWLALLLQTFLPPVTFNVYTILIAASTSFVAVVINKLYNLIPTVI